MQVAKVVVCMEVEGRGCMDVMLIKLLLLSLLRCNVGVGDDLICYERCKLKRGLFMDMDVVDVNVCGIVADVSNL